MDLELPGGITCVYQPSMLVSYFLSLCYLTVLWIWCLLLQSQGVFNEWNIRCSSIIGQDGCWYYQLTLCIDFFHHAAGWYPHVIIWKTEEEKLEVISPGLAGKPDVGNLVVLICLLIHVVLLFPPTASKHHWNIFKALVQIHSKMTYSVCWKYIGGGNNTASDKFHVIYLFPGICEFKCAHWLFRRWKYRFCVYRLIGFESSVFNSSCRELMHWNNKEAW